MADLSVSVGLLGSIVLLSEMCRRTITKQFTNVECAIYFVETISTLQLCACTQELKLLGEVGRIDPQIGLSLTYFITVVHGLTFHGAIGNPCGTLEHACRRRLAGKGALARIACQFLAAAVVRLGMPHVWSLGLSDLHLRHKLLGFKCVSPIRGTLPVALAVELGCAFTVQTALTFTKDMDAKYRVHLTAAVITALVYAGGSVTGAVFNPALAFSTEFRCSGHNFLEYSFVYWLGPLLGMAFFVLLSDKVIPALSGTSTYQKDMDFTDSIAKKTQ